MTIKELSCLVWEGIRGGKKPLLVKCNPATFDAVMQHHFDTCDGHVPAPSDKEMPDGYKDCDRLWFRGFPLIPDYNVATAEIVYA